jgi:hypothetical protein
MRLDHLQTGRCLCILVRSDPTTGQASFIRWNRFHGVRPQNQFPLISVAISYEKVIEMFEYLDPENRYI